MSTVKMKIDDVKGALKKSRHTWHRKINHLLLLRLFVSMSVQTELDIKTQMFINFFYKTLNVEKKKNKQTNK